MPFIDSASQGAWGYALTRNQTRVVKELNITRRTMPDVKGMGLKDALFLLENLNLRVAVKGRGKVARQSITAGAPVSGNQTMIIELD